MFRWARRILVLLIAAAAILATSLWMFPEPSGVSRGFAIADEYPRKNLYVDWGPHSWNLKPFPFGKRIVPHYYLFVAEWHLWKDGTDTLTLRYQPTVDIVRESPFFWSWGDFAIQGGNILQDH